MTNMETLDMPAAAGIDTTAIIVGDCSNGNNAVLIRRDLTLPQIPGKQVLLVENTCLAVSVRARHGQQWCRRPTPKNAL